MIGLVWRWSPGIVRRFDAWVGFHWSWIGTTLVGAVLIAWIIYEFAILPDRIVLQPILIGMGTLMIAIPVLPSMRRHYSTPRRHEDQLAKRPAGEPAGSPQRSALTARHGSAP